MADEDYGESHSEDESDGLSSASDADPEAVEDSVKIDAQADVPAPIKFRSDLVDIACHPKQNIIAGGTISGPISLYTYGVGDVSNKELMTFEHTKKACRALCFSDSGDHLFSGARDGVIRVTDLETNSIFRKFIRESGSSVYSIRPIDNYLLASGEEDGQVVLWDFRMQTAIEVFEDCADYISSLVVNREKKTLLATSSEGILCAYNIRGKKLEMQSESFDCDLLCAGIFKGGTKVVVGALDGSLNIFNWGEFGNISDRFPGHPDSVGSMVVFGEDVVCTGCEDGTIRAVQLFPNRFLGSLGVHSGLSVEKLGLCHGSQWLASSSHDPYIKFWDLSGIEDLKNEDVKDTKRAKQKQLNRPVDDFFADLV